MKNYINHKTEFAEKDLNFKRILIMLFRFIFQQRNGNSLIDALIYKKGILIPFSVLGFQWISTFYQSFQRKKMMFSVICEFSDCYFKIQGKPIGENGILMANGIRIR